MMTSKERAALRAQANPLEVTLIVGKSGISQTLLDEAVILLDSHELVKGRVLETAELTALAAGTNRKAVIDGDTENGFVLAGMSLTHLTKVQPVQEIVEELVSEAERRL